MNHHPLPQPDCQPSRSRAAAPRVSVVINNHNYERLLPKAVDSALEQRGVEVEVIVVDDGSTDHSRDVIGSYGGLIKPVLQKNQGQKAAFNAGFAAAAGDVVIFLDADDELRPSTAARVAKAFVAHPSAARVIFRLEVVDETGRPTGATVPSAGVLLPDGDVRDAVLSHPDDLAWPPTSGNAFAAWALRRVMPLPVDEERTGADLLLHPLIPLLGPVVPLDCVGGAYRLHGANAHYRDHLDVERSRFILRHAQLAHAQLDRLARDLGYGAARPRSVTIAAHRVVSLRLGGAGHPVPGDTRGRALVAGLEAAAGRTDLGVLRRAAYGAWFVAAALGPRRAVRPLAERSFQRVRGRLPLRRADRR